MNNKKIEEIIHNIKNGKDKYFSYGHFDKENMKDYVLMSCATKDLIDVYDINDEDAIDIIQALTH